MATTAGVLFKLLLSFELHLFQAIENVTEIIGDRNVENITEEIIESFKNLNPEQKIEVLKTLMTQYSSLKYTIILTIQFN